MSELTRITVNLTARAAQARDRAAERTGESGTDVVCAALRLYDLMLSLGLTAGDGGVTVIDREGRQLVVVLP